MITPTPPAWYMTFWIAMFLAYCLFWTVRR